MLYMLTIGEQHLNIYEVLMHKLEQIRQALNIMSTENLPITLISSTEVTHVLDQVKTAIQTTNPPNILLFPDLYHHHMKLINLRYDNGFNLLLEFPTFIELYSQKPFALYHLETVPVPIIDTNTEANVYTWLWPRKDYLAMTEEEYISLTTVELSTCKHTGHEYL